MVVWGGGMGILLPCLLVVLLHPLKAQAQTLGPTHIPSRQPSVTPTTSAMPTRIPTNRPTIAPSSTPSQAPSQVTQTPSLAPSRAPSNTPTGSPTRPPSQAPSFAPSQAPSQASQSSAAYTEGPTKGPTVGPTTAPSQTPTRQPTEAGGSTWATTPVSVPGSIKLLSPHVILNGVRSVNAQAKFILQAHPSIQSARVQSWQSVNASLLSVPTNLLAPLNNDYLVLRPGVLAPGRSYVFFISYATPADTKMVVRANLAPVGGTLMVSPRVGFSLGTPFTLRTGNWTDPDATLPLSYAFYATHGISSTLNTATALQLRDLNTTRRLQTYLPPGAGVLAWVLVSDGLGSVSSSADIQGLVQVRNSNSSTAQLTSALQGLGRGGRVEGALADKAVSTLALVSSSLVESWTRGNRSHTLAQLTYTLAASVGNVTRRMSPGTLTLQRATQMVTLLETLVAEPAALQDGGAGGSGSVSGSRNRNATAMAALGSLYTLLATTATAPKTDGSDSARVSVGNSSVRALSSLVAAKLDVGQPSSLDTFDSVLQSVHAITATGMTAGEAATVYVTDSMVSYNKVVSAANASTPMSGRVSSQDSPFAWEVSPATLSSLASSSGSSSLGVSATVWASNKYRSVTLDSQGRSAVWPTNGPTISLALTSSGSNYSSALQVANLSTPIRLRLPFSLTSHVGPSVPSPRAVLVRCLAYHYGTVRVACTSSGLATLVSYLNVTCNGSAAEVTVTCPVAGLCAFFNSSTRQWDTQGCTTLSTQDGVTDCDCNHLTDFTVLVQNSPEGVIGLSSLKVIPPTPVIFKSAALVTLLAVLYGLLLYITMATPPKKRYTRPFLARVRLSRLFLEAMQYMAMLSEKEKVKAAEGSMGGTQNGLDEDAMERLAYQGLARFKQRLGKVDGAEAVRALVTERLTLADHLADVNKPIRNVFRRLWRPARVAADPYAYEIDQESNATSGEVNAERTQNLADHRVVTPAALNLAKLSERQKVFNVFLHALTLLFLTVSNAHGSLEGYVGPGLSSDWQSILAFAVLASRIVLARVLTAFTASSLVRLVFNIINKDSRQAWVLELELLDADVPFVPLRCLPPVIVDSIALATLQVVRVELLLCKHALVDEIRHGTITVPKAEGPKEAEEEVKGRRKKSGAHTSNVLMKVLPPASRVREHAQVRSLSVMEELAVVQRQLAQAEEAFTKQRQWKLGSGEARDSSLLTCNMCRGQLFSSILMGNPLHLFSVTARASRMFDLWFPARLGWSPSALILRVFYPIFVARELPLLCSWSSEAIRSRFCKYLLVLYMSVLTARILLFALDARVVTVLTDLVAYAASVVLAATLWPLVVMLRFSLYGVMLSRLRESLVNLGLEFKDMWEKTQKRQALDDLLNGEDFETVLGASDDAAAEPDTNGSHALASDHEAQKGSSSSHKAVAGKGRKQGSSGRRQERASLHGNYEDGGEGEGEERDSDEEDDRHRKSGVGKAGPRDSKVRKREGRRRSSTKASKVVPSNEEEAEDEPEYSQVGDRAGKGARREERGKRREKRGSESNARLSSERRSRVSSNADQSRGHRASQSRQSYSGGGGGGQEEDAKDEPELEFMT